MLTPTSSAPIRPGLRVTASASTSAELGAGLGQRRVDHRVDQLEVVARGDLGDDAAEALVDRGLRGDDVASSTRGPSRTAAQVSSQEVSIARIKRRSAGSVAGSLQPHDQGVLAVVVVVAAAAAGAAGSRSRSYIAIAPWLEVRTSSV